MENLTIEAYAKINLGLDVLGKLENGYHEVKMVMQTVDISDTLHLRKIPSGIRFLSENGEIPADNTNLAYRAAELFFTTLGINAGVEIELIKRIPVAAGMAGGSTDAAAVLKGLNQLYEKGLSMEQLQAMGLKLGADVPYCIMGGTALAEGIGEKLTGLSPMKDMVLLVVKPNLFVSTAFVYQNLKLSEDTVHPDIDGMVSAIRMGDLDGVISRMGNVLQDVTEEHYPVVKDIIARMEQAGAVKAMMSGSGPTVFGIFESMEQAALAKNEFSEIEQIMITHLR